MYDLSIASNAAPDLCLVIMILRVFALYGRNIYVLSFLMILWVAQVTMSSIGLRNGYGERLPQLQRDDHAEVIITHQPPGYLQELLVCRFELQMRNLASYSYPGCILTGDTKLFRTLIKSCITLLRM